MIIKGLFRKHVIISMSSENNLKFMKNSSLYVANINKLLRNAKSEVLVDFIWSDFLEIMVVTNKVAVQSDLQIIKQYIKNTDDIDFMYGSSLTPTIQVLSENYRHSIITQKS